jgi:hypothetical protein
MYWVAYGLWLAYGLGVYADTVESPGYSPQVTITKQEILAVSSEIATQYPQLSFSQWDIKKMAAPSRAQGGFYFVFNVEALVVQKSFINNHSLIPKTSIKISGNYDDTPPAKKQVTFLNIEVLKK